jgi:hypothetical protein
MTWLTDHLSLILPMLGAISAWLGRRRLASSWRSLQELRRANERLTNCQIDRDEAIRSRDYLVVALRELTGAAALVKSVKDAGLLTTSPTLPNEPDPSLGTSPPSPKKPSEEPPATRSN